MTHTLCLSHFFDRGCDLQGQSYLEVVLSCFWWFWHYLSLCRAGFCPLRVPCGPVISSVFSPDGLNLPIVTSDRFLFNLADILIFIVRLEEFVRIGHEKCKNITIQILYSIILILKKIPFFSCVPINSILDFHLLLIMPCFGLINYEVSICGIFIFKTLCHHIGFVLCTIFLCEMIAEYGVTYTVTCMGGGRQWLVLKICLISSSVSDSSYWTSDYFESMMHGGSWSTLLCLGRVFR